VITFIEWGIAVTGILTVGIGVIALVHQIRAEAAAEARPVEFKVEDRLEGLDLPPGARFLVSVDRRGRVTATAVEEAAAQANSRPPS
jgi:hypothetical protein